jgi:choline dehydrogenase-like flavoprotein
MPDKTTDVLIIGSGHSGGMAAKVLTAKGISCLMLDAGPIADVDKDTVLKPASELAYRGFTPPGQHDHVFQANEFNANVWVDETRIPYTYDADKPYNWVRVRMFGGRSLFWSRQSFRLSDYEFKAKSHDGFGEDWPIDHAELDPWYSRVEGIFRVNGSNDNLAQLPNGNLLLQEPPWPESILRMKAAGAKLGVPFTRQRRALGRDDLASSVNLLLPDAFATGKLEAVPNVIVRTLSVDRNTGLVDGAHFVERLSHREMHVKAKVVILAAGALESTRILLNSGVANSSGVLGHYLSDQIYGAGIVCSVPEARKGKGHPGLMGGEAIIPRFRNLDTKSEGFLRGYALNVYSSAGAMDPRNFADYGDGLENKLAEYHGSGLILNLMGEVLARFENHVRISKDAVDSWGIPALHFSTKYSDNEFNMARDAVTMACALAEDAGFDVLTRNEKPNPPGYSIHEMGTCRMGNDARTSVLNRWNQSHDTKNLYVVDASCFVSSGWQNPTLTLTALAMRAADHLAGQLQRGEL